MKPDGGERERDAQQEAGDIETTYLATAGRLYTSAADSTIPAPIPNLLPPAREERAFLSCVALFLLHQIFTRKPASTTPS